MDGSNLGFNRILTTLLSFIEPLSCRNPFIVTWVPTEVLGLTEFKPAHGARKRFVAIPSTLSSFSLSGSLTAGPDYVLPKRVLISVMPVVESIKFVLFSGERY